MKDTRRPAASRANARRGRLVASLAVASCAFVPVVAGAAPAVPPADDAPRAVVEDDREPPVRRILDALPVSAAQKHVQQTPLVVRDDVVYVANIEPGAHGDSEGMTLHTVVRQGRRGTDARWTWTSTVIDERTMKNVWHTAPGIGMDERGYLHVAYNMHNTPWQYKVARAPRSIESFEFRGQQVSDEELESLVERNRTDFPGAGSAAIPGNQITYPAFYNDSAGHLYATYRFAARPARPFERRAMSSGVARYDGARGAWHAIGGVLPTSPGDVEGAVADAERRRAVASDPGWTSYLPKLAFDAEDRPVISLMWREGIAGAELVRPCLMVGRDGGGFASVDGRKVTLPATAESCPRVPDDDGEYYSIGDLETDRQGDPYLVLSPLEGGRVIVHHRDGEWHSEASPDAASDLFFDASGNLWALSSGLGLSVRRPGKEASWERVLAPGDGDGCYPRAVLGESARIAWLYALGCERDTVSITRVDLEALLESNGS